MPESAQRYDFDRVFRLIMTLLTVGLTVWLLIVLSDVLVPFAVAVLLAYLLNPIVNAFQRKTGRRGTAVALTLAVFFVFMLVAIPLVAWLVGRELLGIAEVFSNQELKARLHQAVEPVLAWLEDEQLRQQLREQVQALFAQLQTEQLHQWGAQLGHWLAAQLGNLFGMAVGLLGGLINALLGCSVFVVVLLYLIFLMMDFNAFQAKWKDQLPPDYRDTIVSFFDEFSLAMGRYFRGQFLVAMSCGVLFAIGFSIVGLRMAVLLGLFVGLLNMVPYLQTIGLIPAILLALLKAFEDNVSPLGPLLGTLAVFAVVQLIQDAVLTPKIMGQSTGLKPWVILLSIFVWGKLLGFLGLVLAIPLSCLGLAYYRRFILKIGATQTAPAAA